MKHKWHEVHFMCDVENCCATVIINDCDNYHKGLKYARIEEPNWYISMNKVLCEKHKNN